MAQPSLRLWLGTPKPLARHELGDLGEPGLKRASAVGLRGWDPLGSLPPPDHCCPWQATATTASELSSNRFPLAQPQAGLTAAGIIDNFFVRASTGLITSTFIDFLGLGTHGVHRVSSYTFPEVKT